MYVSDHIHALPTLQLQLHETFFFLEDRVGSKDDLPHVPFREGITVLEQLHHFSDELKRDGVFSCFSILRKLWASVCLVEFTPTYITHLEGVQERNIGFRLTIRDDFQTS